MTENDTFRILRQISSTELHSILREESYKRCPDVGAWYVIANKILDKCGWTMDEYIAHTMKKDTPINEVFYISSAHRILYEKSGYYDRG